MKKLKKVKRLCQKFLKGWDYKLDYQLPPYQRHDLTRRMLCAWFLTLDIVLPHLRHSVTIFDTIFEFSPNTDNLVLRNSSQHKDTIEPRLWLCVLILFTTLLYFFFSIHPYQRYKHCHTYIHITIHTLNIFIVNSFIYFFILETIN